MSRFGPLVMYAYILNRSGCVAVVGTVWVRAASHEHRPACSRARLALASASRHRQLKEAYARLVGECDARAEAELSRREERERVRRTWQQRLGNGGWQGGG